MSWLYNGTLFTENQIGDAFGFVYLIENKITNKKYVGKKFFTKAKTKQVKGKKKKTRVSSDWESYYGSNKILAEEVEKNGTLEYERTILHLCRTRAECSYLESYEIFSRHALIREDYYNDWVSAKVRRAHLKSLIAAKEKKS